MSRRSDKREAASAWRPAGRALLGAVFLTAALAAPSRGQGFAEGVELEGFLLQDYAGRVRSAATEQPGTGELLLAEQILRLDLTAWADPVDASIRVKVDLAHDALVRRGRLDVREAYLDYSAGRFDIRLGRQITTWGVGDLLFINDVFPKDWVAFFTGRPLEYLKIGVDGVRTRYTSPAVNLDVIVVPVFTPDTLPGAPRFLVGGAEAVPSAFEVLQPELTYGNTELGIRLYRRVLGLDVSAYLYRGFWRMPSPTSGRTNTGLVLAVHHELSTVGVSAQGSALGGVLSGEAGYYRSSDDPNGRDPLVPNSQARFLVGYQRQPWQDGTIGVQYYTEIMTQHARYLTHLPAGFAPVERYSDMLTVRVEQLLAHQTWRLALMTFYGLANADHLVQPQATYAISDRLSVTVGANVLGGRRGWTPFGRLGENDNMYASVRFDF